MKGSEFRIRLFGPLFPWALPIYLVQVKETRGPVRSWQTLHVASSMEKAQVALAHFQNEKSGELPFLPP